MYIFFFLDFVLLSVAGRRGRKDSPKLDQNKRKKKLGNFPVLLHIPLRPKLLQKNSLQRRCLGAINFVKITKESLYKANSLACFLAKRDTPVAATLQRKSSGGIIL